MPRGGRAGGPAATLRGRGRGPGDDAAHGVGRRTTARSSASPRTASRRAASSRGRAWRRARRCGPVAAPGRPSPVGRARAGARDRRVGSPVDPGGLADRASPRAASSSREQRQAASDLRPPRRWAPLADERSAIAAAASMAGRCARPLPTGFQIPATNPSTRNVGMVTLSPRLGHSSAGTIRDRSHGPGARCRSPAGGGRGRARRPRGRARSGSSNSSRPRSSRNVRRPGAQPLEDLAQAGEARPRRRVGHRRRPEGAQVAEHHLVDRRGVAHRPAGPVVQRRERDGTRPAPQAPGGHLDRRQEVADRVGERPGVQVRPARGKLVPQLRQGPRPLLHQLLPVREDRVEVHALDPGAPGPVCEQLPVQHGLDHGPERGPRRRRSPGGSCRASGPCGRPRGAP